jgi:hypothetical protein
MDSVDKTFIAGCISFVLFFAIISGAFLYGHIYTTDKYNDSMNKCIAANGSWIPTNQGTSGACIVRN